MKKGSIAYFIDESKTVRSGVLVNVVKPTAQEKKQGAFELYEFGHGFSTPTVFKTEKDANKYKEGTLYERTIA